MAANADVIIVGGGVIGCAIAFELSRRKVPTLVLERDQVGYGASHASAGMVAPLSDNLGEGPLIDLGIKSFRMYQGFLDEVQEAAGMSVECMHSGIIRTATDDHEVRELQPALGIAKCLGLELELLDGDAARELEPLVGPKVIGATYSPTEPHVNPSRLVEALRRGAVANGASFREQVPATGLVTSGSRVAGVRSANEAFMGDLTVLATGSWACQAGDWLGLDVPIQPVRGQVIYVNKLERPLRHSVMHGMTYATPKGDGTTLVGSTLEHAGFDPRVTVSGVASILSGVQELVPSIGATTINHARAGLRPWSRDHLPVLGHAPGNENVIIASGHYRSGILLAPVTAGMIADLVMNGPSSVELGPYNASRLSGQAA